MKLIPNYSYEFNCVLNEGFSEEEQIKNFASLLSDKDRFLVLLPLLEGNRDFIEERLGYKLPKEVEFYIVRAEKFKSFSKPITIEYSILPEEMILFLLKEILKISISDRFQDELQREEIINSFIDFVSINGNWGKVDLVKFGKNLHDWSKSLFENYELKDIDFSKMTLKDYLFDLYNN